MARSAVPSSRARRTSGDRVTTVVSDNPTVLTPGSHLDRRSIVAARIAGAIGLAIVAFPTLVGVGVIVLIASWHPGQKLGLLTLWIGVMGLLTVTVIMWPALRFRHTRYRVDENALTISRGVIWRSVTSVPTSRIQHTDVLQGPLQRQFGLATLIVHTAGTQDAAVSLSGLAHRDALPLRDSLIAERDEDGGDKHPDAN